jgi:ligand-binding sensor domain-containing protein/serine phosphatase RsbU (regulator of sigma subunit)
LLLIALFYGCSDPQPRDRPGRFRVDNPPLVEVALDISEGHRINALTGDPVMPVISSTGDTVQTGVPIRARGIIRDPKDYEPPVVVRAGTPLKFEAHPNVLVVPEELRQPPVKVLSLFQPVEAAEDREQITFTNFTGDTVPTGIALPVEGRAEAFRQKRAMPALPPGMKDNAISNLKYLDVYHGLFSSQVFSLLEDRFGRMWIGTSGGGVSIYDGSTFSYLTSEEGLCDSDIICSLEDSQGNLWFGSSMEGVIKFDGMRFTHYSERQGLINNVIYTLFEDSGGIIWFGTLNGLARFDGETLTHYTVNEGLPHNRVNALAEDSQGRLLIGTQAGMAMFDGQQMWTAEHWKGIPVTAILERSDGVLWVGTYTQGAYRVEGDLIQNFSTANEFGMNAVNTIMEDSYGRLWFGLIGNGAARFDGRAFTIYTIEEGLSVDWVVPILEDRRNQLWMGTIGGGVNILNDHSFTHQRHIEGVVTRAVSSLTEAEDGSIWFGKLISGITRYDGTSFYNYSVDQGLHENLVESIFMASDGTLWAGTSRGGASRFDGIHFRHFGYRQGFTGYPVGSIVEDQEGKVWFATLGDGAYSYDGDSFTHFSESSGLPSNYLESCYMDSQGNIWFSSLGGGVCRFDGEFFTTLSEVEGMSSNFVSSIFEDKQGTLWFGTMNKGLTCFDGQTFTHYSERHGLNDNFIQAITQDDKDRLWISTGKGLNLIVDPGADSSFRILSYGLEDGLKGTSFMQNSVLIDAQNRLWLGNNKDLTMLKLEDFETESQPPSVILNNVEFNGRFVDYRNASFPDPDLIRFDSVAPFFNYPLSPDLDFSQNSVSFDFSGVDLSAPSGITFSYKMEGIDKEWSPASRRSFALYRNLRHGDYTFLVRTKGASTEWSEPLAYSFNVLPPWWLTWYLWIVYVGLPVLIVYGILAWRTRRLKRRQKVLEAQVEERTQQIVEINDELKQQNDNLARQRDEITQQKEKIDLQNRSIRDSIEYARRIQKATIPPDEVLSYLLPRHFVLYKPLDIVSGDFYWLEQKGEKLVLAVADCTGHGVPGAFMSMLGSALLKDIVNNIDELEANLVLNSLREQVISSLRQTGAKDEARDGMDIGLIILDREKLTLQFAGARHNLYLVRQGELEVIKGDRMPIGISDEAGKSFSNTNLQLKKDDAIYLFTDGYVDQLGGQNRKRFMTSRLKELLLEIQDRIMMEQKRLLETRINEWMGRTGKYPAEYEQIDDILVVGIKL